MNVLSIKRSLIFTATTAGVFFYSMAMHAQAKTPDAKTATGAAASTDQYIMPQGWQRSGTQPAKYLMGIVKGAGQKGANAGTIKSIGKVAGTGVMKQSFDPEKYIGKKVKLTGYIRSEQVTEWAGLWMRIDDSTKKSINFDNMVKRPVKGTTGWTKCEIVMDVAANAANISYGALLHGSGQIWFDNIDFEIVKPAPLVEARLKEPTNMNFEK